jgi:hypothetical protein
VPDGDKEVLTYAEMKKIIVVALDKTASAVEQRPAVEPSPVEPQGDSLHQQEVALTQGVQEPAAAADYEEQAAVNLELIEAMTRPPGGAAALASVGSDDLLAVAEFVDATGGGCGDGLPECGTGGGGNAAAQQEEGEKGSREEDLAQ